MAAIAHEIGTPMTTILGYAELLAKSVGDEKNRQRATTIVEQVHRVSELTEQLLVLSRSPAGSPRAVALDAALDAALADCAGAAEQRGVRLERRFSGAPTVHADPRRLQQVVVQLLLQAIDATPRQGTLRLSLVELEDGEVEVCARDEQRTGEARADGGARFRLTLPAAR
jgi:signal transduction histidine kinase